MTERIALWALAAEARGAYTALCAEIGVDREAELVEARLAHGEEGWRWMAARLRHRYHQQTRPRSRWNGTDVDRWVRATTADPDGCEHAAALVAAYGPARFAQAVARRTTSTRLLVALLDGRNDAGSTAAAASMHLPADAVTVPAVPAARLGFARRHDLTDEVFEQLANDPDWTVRATLAQYATAPSRLERLASDPAHPVRHHVAANPYTLATVLGQLAADPDHGVRRSVATNSRTPKRILTRLAAEEAARAHQETIA